MQKSHWAAIAAAAVLLILGFVVARALYFGASATATYEPPEREYSEVDLEQAALSARNIAEEIPVEAYLAAVRSFTDELGIECSPESYTVAQVMFLHSAMTGFESEAWTHIVEGDPYPVSEAWSETAGSGDLDDLDDDDFLLDIAYEPLDVIDAEVDKALELLVAEGLDYDDWLMVGAALFHQYRGSLDDDGFGRDGNVSILAFGNTIPPEGL